jgi:hypothetical protein
MPRDYSRSPLLHHGRVNHPAKLESRSGPFISAGQVHNWPPRARREPSSAERAAAQASIEKYMPKGGILRVEPKRGAVPTGSFAPQNLGRGPTPAPTQRQQEPYHSAMKSPSQSGADAKRPNSKPSHQGDDRRGFGRDDRTAAPAKKHNLDNAGHITAREIKAIKDTKAAQAEQKPAPSPNDSQRPPRPPRDPQSTPIPQAGGPPPAPPMAQGGIGRAGAAPQQQQGPLGTRRRGFGTGERQSSKRSGPAGVIR